MGGKKATRKQSQMNCDLSFQSISTHNSRCAPLWSQFCSSASSSVYAQSIEGCLLSDPLPFKIEVTIYIYEDVFLEGKCFDLIFISWLKIISIMLPYLKMDFEIVVT